MSPLLCCQVFSTHKYKVLGAKFAKLANVKVSQPALSEHDDSLASISGLWWEIFPYSEIEQLIPYIIATDVILISLSKRFGFLC